MRLRRSETCILALARIKGYVIVEAMLFDTAAKRNVSRGEWTLDVLGELRKLSVFGGKDDLKSSKR